MVALKHLELHFERDLMPSAGHCGHQACKPNTQTHKTNDENYFKFVLFYLKQTLYVNSQWVPGRPGTPILEYGLQLGDLPACTRTAGTEKLEWPHPERVILFFVMCMYMGLAWVYAQMYGCLQRPEDGTGSPGAGVTGCEPQNMSPGNRTWAFGKSRTYS